MQVNNVQITDMPVIFVRHNRLGLPLADLRALWDEPRMVLDYSGNQFLLEGQTPGTSNPDHYRGRVAKAAFRLLNDIAAKGALVCLCCRELGGDYRDTIRVGIVPPGREIEPRVMPGRTLKTLRLDNPKDFSAAQHPVLGALHPKLKTICHWHIGEAHIRALYLGLPLQNTALSLMPCQLEVLVFHSLLEQRRLIGLLMPIGRSLIDVDIVALGPESATLGPGKRGKVFVQVTHHDNATKVKEKWDRMKGFEKDGECLIAARGKCPDGIPEKAFLSIDQIYEDVHKPENPLYRLYPVVEAMREYTWQSPTGLGETEAAAMTATAPV